MSEKPCSAPSSTTPSEIEYSVDIVIDTIVDVVFGIVAPILCLIFDPIVFRGTESYYIIVSPIIPPALRLFSYTAMGLGMATLSLWLAFRETARRFSPQIAGVLFVGPIYATILGLVMLPYSALGIFAEGIGCFGFLPFAAAVIYGRNAWRAYRLARTLTSDQTYIRLSIFAGAVLLLGISALAQVAAISMGLVKLGR